jgi:hypothetical protein
MKLLAACNIFMLCMMMGHVAANDNSTSDPTLVLLFLFFGLGVGVLIMQLQSMIWDSIPYTVVVFMFGIAFALLAGQKGVYFRGRY